MQRKTPWLAFALLFWASHLLAQTIVKPNFAVQLGVFRSPDLAKFQPVADLGQLLTDSTQAGLVRLRLGDYPSRAQADSVLGVLRARGFKSGFVVQAPASSPRGFAAASGRASAYQVQLGAYSDRSSVPANVDQLKQLGNVQEVEEGELLKLRLGTFDSRKDAEAQAQAAKQLGFKSAYVSEASQNTLARESLVRGATGKAFEITNTYKRMEGLLNGRFPVVVQVYFNGSSLLGFYNDPETNEHRKFVYYGYKTGHDRLPGSLTSSSRTGSRPSSGSAGQVLQIVTKDQATGRELRFNLRETYSPQSAQIVIKTLYRKKIQPAKDGEIGADIYVEYPVITRAGNASLGALLNPQLVQVKGVTDPNSLSTQVDLALAEGLKKVGSFYPQYRWLSETLETKVLENSQDLLSVRLVEELVIAEPKSKITHRSFQLSTGRELKLADQLTAGHERPLRTILRRKVGKKYEDLRAPLADVNSSVDEMLANYYFTSRGIVFYRQYRASSVIQEPIEITVDYREVRSLVRPGSLASRF
jgi:SPOR domain